MTVPGAKTAGVRSPGRAAIAKRTLRTDRWWAYPVPGVQRVHVQLGVAERSADQRYDPLGRVLRSWRHRDGRPPRQQP